MAGKLEISDFTIERAKELLIKFADCNFTPAMEIVFTQAISTPERRPTVRLKKGTTVTIEEYVEAWVNAYVNGYNNRPSIRTGKKSKVKPDEIIGLIVKARIPEYTEDEVKLIVDGHSLLMSVENLLGDILEEYLSIALINKGWYCAWGTTIDAVDFCKEDGTLLQIKNSDNSENSSSSKVRAGTKILKWSRRKSKGGDSWSELSKMTGIEGLDEDDFRNFAISLVSNNPDCIVLKEE